MNNTKKKSPISWVPTAYFAMGLPFVVLNMVTVLMFKGLEVDDKLITFWTSLILLPWTLKPLWSPFLELFRTKKFFVIVTQLITGVTFGLVAFALNLSHFFSISIALPVPSLVQPMMLISSMLMLHLPIMMEPTTTISVPMH